MYFLDRLDSLDCNCTVWISTKTEVTPPGRVPQFSACSVGSPRYRDKVREQEAAEVFTAKSAPLGHKSGMSHREIKSNTYVTSTHFSGFLQNQSSYKTVITEILQLAIVCHPPVDIVAMQICKRKACLFLNSGGETYPSFSWRNPAVWVWNFE